jgi:hypothetical protein
MIEKKCFTCGSLFYVENWKLKHNANKYCSRVCIRSKKSLLSYEERFWSKVLKSDGCWEWSAGKFKAGYGAFSYNQKPITAHSFSWFLKTGDFAPKGKEIMHICDNRGCVKPEHLRLGSHQENMEDCKNKLRHNYCDKNSKLSKEDVTLIRSMYRPKDKRFSTLALARIFNVSRSNISSILRNDSWKLLT